MLEIFALTMPLWEIVRVPALRGMLRHRQTPLIENGRMIRRNMRAELVTKDELMAALRKEGVDGIEQVRSACLEADGEISVLIERSGEPTG